MKTEYRRPSPGSMMPGYSTNAVLRLIIICGVGYVGFLFTAVCFQAFGLHPYNEAVAIVKPYIALPARKDFTTHFWTLFTYGWSHGSFLDWVTDMIWLFSFGSIVQSLIGYKQVIPMFFYSCVVGGIFYMASQYIPGSAFTGRAEGLLGAQAGVMALAVACITISPRYRIFLAPNLGIPAIALVLVYLVLSLVRVNLHMPEIFLLAGGGLMGFVYIKLTQQGYNLGEWIYDLGSNMERRFSPLDNKKDSGVISQNLVDDLLDKINQKGMRSLSREEKKLLERIGKQGNN